MDDRQDSHHVRAEEPVPDRPTARPGNLGPLAGLRVLDVTHVMAGAWCSCLLAQMGADVVKVERPGEGEELRRAQARAGGRFRPFDAVNHGKRSIAVDLGREPGVEVLRRLAEQADVFVENYRPGSLERRGLGYAELSGRNPRLIYASISAFGATGPYRERAGFDLVAQSMSGILSVTGEPGGGPVAAGVPVADLTAGTLAALGIVSAWADRLRSGLGQRVDTSLLEAALSLTVWESAMVFDTGSVPEPNGARHRLAAPYGVFPTADGWIVVAAATQGTFHRLCDAIQRPDLLADPRFQEPITRLANREALEGALASVFAERSATRWIELLEACGVPCAPVLDMAAVWRHPQVLARDMVATAAAPDDPHPLRVVGPAVKLSRTPWHARAEAPAQGEHAGAVLRDFGFDPDEVESLYAGGVVAAPGTRRV